MDPAEQASPPWAPPPHLTANSFVSPAQLDAVSDSGSTADWVSVHASPPLQSAPGAPSPGEGASSDGDGPLAEPALPICAQPQASEPSEVASSGDPAVEEASITDGSSLDAGLPVLGVQRQGLRDAGREREGEVSAEDALSAVLEATLAPKMESALRGVWDGSGRRDVTDRGRIVRLTADGCVLKAKDLMQRLVGLLCRDVGSPAGKQAAADFMAWLIADRSCARALKRPEKIVRTFVGLIGEDVLEIRRNGARAIRNLAEQSAEYAKELAVPERLQALAQMPPMSDALLCVYFAETVVSLERHLRGSDAWTLVGDSCIAALLDAAIAAQEPQPMVATLTALKSLSSQSNCANVICTSPPAMKKICGVVTWKDGQVREAAVCLLAWLLMGDLSPRRLWEELLSEGESNHLACGLFSLLDMGQTELEAALLRLLIVHPNLAMIGAVGARQLGSVEGLLNSPDCSLVCQDHAMTLLLKLVDGGLDPTLFVSGSDLVLTLIQHVIQLKGDNRHVRNLALELLKQLVTKDGGVSVIEAVIECGGVEVVKYLLQETAAEKQVDLASLLSLLWAVSRAEGGKALVSSAGIVPLLVEKLRDPAHGLEALHCLHHFVADDAAGIEDLAACRAGSEPPILEALAGMVRMGDCASQEPSTHPLRVLALLMSCNNGRDAVVRDINKWVNLLMGFAGHERDGIRRQALDCIMCLHDTLAEDSSRLWLLLEDPSLLFVSWMLASGPQHRHCALLVLSLSCARGGAVALEASGIYSSLFRLIGEEGIAQSDLAQVLLRAVVGVGATDLAACAMQVMQHQVQDALWSLAGCCTQPSVFGAILSLLKEVRNKEVEGKGTSGLVQCMRAALDDKKHRIHQLEAALHGRDGKDSQTAQLQQALVEKERTLIEYEAEKKEQEHGIRALTDLVNQQHLLIRDLRAVTDMQAYGEGSSGSAGAD